MDEILQYAGERELEKIEAFWSQDFKTARRAIKELFKAGLLELNHQKLANLSSFFRLSIGEIEVEEEIKVKIHGLLLGLFVTWLNSHTEDNSSQIEKLASEFKLCVEAESFYYPALVSAFQIILTEIEEGKPVHLEVFSMFSQLLNAVNSTADLLIPEDETHVSGTEFFEDILVQLCSKPVWPSSYVVPIVHCACDLMLNPAQLERFVEKIQTVWSTLEIDEIPPLVYQLLLLSKKGARKAIIGQILNYFNQLPLESEEGKNNAVLTAPSKRSQIEGTVILHIFEASRNEKELGHYIVNKFKGGKYAYLSPFTLGVLLSLSRNSTYQSKALEYLKSSILAYYQDSNSYNNLLAVKRCYSLRKLDDLFYELLARCHYGWDLVLQGLIEFFIGILDTQPRVFWKTTESSRRVPKNGPKQPLDCAHNLARRVLLGVFKDYEVYQLEIFERILARLTTNSDSTAQYIRLLKVIIHSVLHQLSDVTPKIKDAIPILTSLPLATAKAVLDAWAPLINHNPSFLDLLIMVLKKGLFIKTSAERLVSLTGLLFVLEMAAKGKIPYGNSGEGLHPICLEILGILRRCLTQQAEIRVALYEGLKDAIMAAPALAPQAAEFLYLHAGRYYDARPQVVVPIKIDECLNPHSGSILSEPLPALLSALVAAVLAMDSSNQGHAYKMIMDILNRLPHAEPNDFGLADDSSFNQDTLEGIHNSAKTTLLLGVYENLMDFTRFETDNDTRLAIVASLYERHNEIFQLFKAKATDSRGKPVIKGGIQSTFLPIEAAVELLQLMILPEEPTSPTLPRAAITQFLFDVCIVHANTLENSGHNIKAYYHAFATISSILVLNRTLDLDPSAIQVGFSCLLKLLECFLIYDGRFEARFTEILGALCSSVTPDESIPFHDIVMWFLSQMMALLKEYTLSQVTLMLELVNRLLQVLRFKAANDGFEMEQFVHTLNEMENTLRADLGLIQRADAAFSKQVMKLYLLHGTLSEDFSVLPHFMTFILLELRALHRDGETEEDEVDEAYASLGPLITKTTIPGHLTITFSHLIDRIEIFAWAISHSAQNHELDEAMVYLIRKQLASTAGIEKAICQEFTIYVNALSILVRSQLGNASAEQLLDVLNHCYKFLKSFTRHKLKYGLTRSDSFISLMEQVETTLTKHVFVFITYTQTMTSNCRPKKAQKTKEGDRVGRAKGASKEIRMLSSLTLNLEQFELHLYQLYSKFKINVKHAFKRSTVRDFRINKELFLRSPSPVEEDPKALIVETVEDAPEVAEPDEEGVVSDAEEEVVVSDQEGEEKVEASDEEVVGSDEEAASEEASDDGASGNDQDQYDSDMIDDS
ncbi:hypothetical protein DSO57_1012476 [Entomophthora muscae]|uniref:Uncharacterized protein n=1 Tax=Entomophthora muscae TaxID=34485 RepID=A0ACC2TTQ6_9FUNG|nr:hypothetical protein DSO57_1012476 [Entomophthora muscae]